MSNMTLPLKYAGQKGFRR